MRRSGLGRVFREIFATRSASRGIGALTVNKKQPGAAVALGALLCLLALSITVTPASAATVTQRPLLFSFNGADTTGGALRSAQSIAVDNATGAVYVGEKLVPSFGDPTYIDRFHPDGTAWPFSSTGLSSVTERLSGGNLGPGLSVAVNNTSSAAQSQLFFSSFGAYAEALEPSGKPLWWFRPNNAPLEVDPSDAAIDAAGHYWLANGTPGHLEAIEYANVGSPPSRIASLPFASEPRKLDFDASGNLYVVIGGSVEKWTDGSFVTTIDPHATDVYVDQSSAAGHIFTVNQTNEIQRVEVGATAGEYRLSFGGSQTADLPYNATASAVESALEALPSVGADNILVQKIGAASFRLTFQNLLGEADVEEVVCEDGTTPLSGGTGCTVSTLTQGEVSDFQEYAPDGTLLGTFGEGVIGNAASIAYNPTLDRVYLVQEGTHPSVRAFGASITGTTPDATIEAPSAVGISSAHFSGTVNPQDTSSEWRFEWRKGGQSWGDGGSSPAQALPVDSSDHTVEYTTNALRGDTAYQVRLVAVNTANQLVGVSGVRTFATAIAPQAPAVTLAPPTAIGAHTATVTGTINPQGDTAEWRVQVSADPDCASGFTNQALQEITTGSASPVDVEYEVANLLPSEHYCARIVATNSAGSTTSTTEEFETLDATPTQVFTAYAAPRTDTTARLNGYINPEGSEATYRFEYSQDGTNWTTLADHSTPRTREQIVVGEEITGLSPDTTYRYRFVAENGAGLEEGEEKTFTTRSSAEMQLPTRGVELVNQPDKGNQGLAMQRPFGRTPMVTSDGNRALWNVIAGAPGGNSGTYVNYLSTRTPSGWVSRALLPPAEEQVGAGGYAYRLTSLAPDFRHFVMRAAEPEATSSGPQTYVRLDDNQHQDVLKSLAKSGNGDEQYDGTAITEDGSHVLVQNFESGEIEDISSGAAEVVSIMPDGTPSECSAGFAFGVNAKSGYSRMDVTDASRVYFEAVANGQPCETGSTAIFYRDRNTEQTIEVDPGSTAELHSAIIRATPDGRRLYFVTTVSHVGEDSNHAADIYDWDADAETYECLTCVVPNPGLSVAGTGVDPSAVLISRDFSHIYFRSSKELVPGYGIDGVASLYVLHDGEVRFVAPVGFSNVTDNGELSSDGNVLVWRQELGRAKLTSDELPSQCPSIVSSGGFEPCKEFYRYEDSTGGLECISCALGRPTANAAASPGVIFDQALSADGHTVAFTTKEVLVPEDINNTFDVYEWRNGAIGLVSDGETVFPSSGSFNAPKVYGIDATGENIFFSLIEPGLTGYEQDRFANLYDARIGGGFPRPQPPEHCSEESCQGPLQTPPIQASAGSAGLSGAGNVAPAARKSRCLGRRGDARRRCLHPRKRHKRRTHGRNHTTHPGAKHRIGGSR